MPGATGRTFPDDVRQASPACAIAPARTEASMQGLTGHNRILLPDFRKVTGQFDRIVSTEMIEAVGQSCRETCFKTLYDRAAYPTYPTCRAWRLIRLPTGCVSGRPVNE
ncbi:MAG: class I SAM-dependent methyltransferase [Nitratireductor sp.]|nr:class I SAM-dependent methyltransferase [Nitratireductor sp.]